jgi:putative PIN family toxin of toxin-antitoxin system
MKVVLDTNVVVSAVLIRGGNESHVLAAWRGGVFDLILSPQLLEELGRVLSYPKIRDARWMTEAEVVELVQILAEESILVPGHLSVTASRDPADDKFLAAAVEADADYLVTGDKDLLTLKTYRHVKIVTPAVFRQMLQTR